ncbi:hypothetical protein OEA41_002712 [Lepraria neglecta]|uniref:TLC domain-containing protein n=1 Tax=Lepraria neglecta TaxID=209136 RepID=A0AAD9Z4F6_9LECA|nr:hypothetical protein OEA41_002712 [Lepraria neglecta]
MTGSRPQWYNGIVLLFSFFCCRLLWGAYQSIRVYQDVWAALHYDPIIKSKPVFEPAKDSNEMMIMRFSGEYVVPTWLACVYLGSNIVLNTLNFYWFGKMIETIKKRFRDGGNKKRGAGEEKEEGVLVEGLMDSSTLITEITEDGGEIVGGNGQVGNKGKMEAGFMNGGNFIEVEQTQVRQRKA